MREIRFRIWNPGGNNMLYDISNVYECLMQQIAFNESQPGHERLIKYDHVADGMVWMQFTGLKDKNGIDIYEGDVCKILYTDWPSKSNDDSRTIKQYMDDIAKVGVIEYSQDGFYFVTKDRHGELNYSHILPGKHGFVKVIGNMYQNPELLK